MYFAGGPDFINNPTVPVLDTETNTLVATIIVGSPPPPLRFTHSLAVDRENNRLFVPISGVGVKVELTDKFRAPPAKLQVADPYRGKPGGGGPHNQAERQGYK